MATPAGSAYSASTVKLNHIIWFGSPGAYDPMDKRHDQAWYNYLNPMLRIAEAGKLGIKPNDTMHWCIYSTGYKKRWDADSKSDRQFIRDHVTKVKNYGSKDYIDHVKRRAAEFSAKYKCNIKVKELATSKEFWEDLKTYPSKSVSSVWYFGHARHNLWLELEHDRATHTPQLSENPNTNCIAFDDIKNNEDMLRKLLYNSSISSKFYGCNTMKFADYWHSYVWGNAEGADGTMEFGTWVSDVTKILPTLETGILSDGSNSGTWVKYIS
jgi:hypothetical protein